MDTPARVTLTPKHEFFPPLHWISIGYAVCVFEHSSAAAGVYVCTWMQRRLRGGGGSCEVAHTDRAVDVVCSECEQWYSDTIHRYLK